MTLAYHSTANKRHGCIIVKGGNVVAFGYNVYRTKPFFTSQEHMDRCSVHAEVAALRSNRGDLRGATVYVARINNQGEERFSAPCNKCEVALMKRGIKKAIWTQ